MCTRKWYIVMHDSDLDISYMGAYTVNISRLISNKWLEKSTFLNAIRALCGKNSLVWKQGREVFGRWGWYEDEFLTAFRKSPRCMIVSEKNLMQAMDLLVNQESLPNA